MPSKRRTLEALAILAGVYLVTRLLVSIDAFEIIYAYSRAHEEYELDELLLAMPVLVLGLFVFVSLRIREANAEIKRRRAAEEEARIAYEEAQEMRKLKGEYTAILSHELRTPLNGMLGILELLKHENLSPQIREMVDLAHRSGWNLQRMLDDVIEFTRLTQGSALKEQAPFQPKKAILSVYELLVPLAQRKGLTMPQPDTSGLPDTLMGSEGPLRQIMSCLVGNAIKFTDVGSVRIQASVQNGAQDGKELVLRVVDTGPGIAKEDQEKIFEPYTQLDQGRDRRKGGIGLGLSFARRLVAMLDGSIVVFSEPGQGATFEARIPVAIP